MMEDAPGISSFRLKCMKHVISVMIAETKFSQFESIFNPT